MSFLTDKRRPAVVATALVLLGAAALLVGAGEAHAGWPCNDQPQPQDTTVNISNNTYVGLDVYNTGSTSGAHGFWLCVAPTGGEPNQQVVLVTVEDPASNPAPGATVSAAACGVTGISSTPHPWMTEHCGANYAVAPTGAEVNPTTTTDAPADGNSTSAVTAGVASGTCSHTNGTPTCPFGSGATIGAITIRERDLPAVTRTTSTPPPACTGINNTCPGAYVEVGGDRSNDTVSGTVNHDVPYNCVQVNSVCPT